ncbi:MAG: bifunctional oligoribonuclease/PAP phosphatase NrnA [Bacteroidetes bacterium]|nr:bifunctional oligoribonuclease/PAP phosphatase NrnA [Bacteroidota bacterium]
MNFQIITNIGEQVQLANNIVIVTHSNPDGDAIGSSLGLLHFLQSYYPLKSIKVVVPNEFPSFLKWLPGVDQILIYDNSKVEVADFLNNCDLCFCLDFNSLKRIDSLYPILRSVNAPKILIDHHPQPDNDFEIVLSCIEFSSTSELIYEVVTKIGGKEKLNMDIANCLYVGIMTDTGSFSYASNRPELYIVVSELIKQGIDAEFIHRKVYDTYSETRMRLLGHCLSNCLVLLPHLHTAYIHLSKEDLQNFNYQNGDTEGVVNYSLSIQGVVLAALFTEKDGMIRISLRSKGSFNVNEFSRKYFNGGGHKNAAGGTLYSSLTEAIAFFENSVLENRCLIDEAFCIYE